MARAHSIWVVCGRYTGVVYVAFTVKREAIRWVDERGPGNLKVLQFHDAGDFMQSITGEDFVE